MSDDDGDCKGVVSHASVLSHSRVVQTSYPLVCCDFKHTQYTQYLRPLLQNYRATLTSVPISSLPIDSNLPFFRRKCLRVELTPAEISSCSVVHPTTPTGASRVKTVCWNVNGVSSAWSSGALKKCILRHRPDSLLLCEVKITATKLRSLRSLHMFLFSMGYTTALWNLMSAPPGCHHGTAFLSRVDPLRVIPGWFQCPHDDVDGRVLTVVFPTYVVVHTYVPCTSWPEHDMPTSKRLAKDNRRRQFDIDLRIHAISVSNHFHLPIIWTGDQNVALTSKDSHSSKLLCRRDMYPGHKPWERQSCRDTLRTLSLCDSYRQFHPTPSACDYTCWRSTRYWSRAQGERLDHVFCDPQLLRVDEGTSTVLSDIYVDQSLEGSDHAAVVFEMSPSGHPARDVTDSKTAEEPTPAPMLCDTPSHSSNVSVSLPASASPPDEVPNRVTAALASLCGKTGDSLAHLEYGPDGPPTSSNCYRPCLSSLQEVEFDCWEKSSSPPLHKSTAMEDVALSLVDVDNRIKQIMPDSELESPSPLASDRVLFDSLNSCHGNEVTVPSTQVTFADSDNVVATALWDTGASYSIISRRTALQFGGKALLRPTAGGPSFTLADKTVVRSLASISLSVKVSAEGPPIRHRFWVLPGLSFDLIFGCDFFTAHAVGIDFSDHSIHVKGFQPIPFRLANSSSFSGAVSPVVLTEDLCLKPGKHYQVNVKVLSSSPLKSATGRVGLISRAGSGCDPSHSLSTALVSLKGRSGDVTPIRMANLTDSPTRLKSGTIVGYFQDAVFVSCVDVVVYT